MKKIKLKFRKLALSSLLITMLWEALSLQSCDKMKGTSTIYGIVTEIGNGPIDSIKIAITATKGINDTKFLATVLTDENGKYEATVDVPSGYGRLECGIPFGGNPKFELVYRGADAYKDGQKVNTCCSATVGGKTNYDFKLFK